jgi:Protein of unknown function (DUF3987)
MPEKTTVRDILAEFISGLNSQFTSWSPTEFMDFVSANSDLTGDFIPVDDRKNVIVPKGTKLDDCAITEKSLRTLVNSLGRPGRYKGIGGPTAEPITAHGVALRALYKRVHIDLDLNFFGATGRSGESLGETECDRTLLAWVEKCQSVALKVRGNRQRLTLIFGIDADLQKYIVERYGPKIDERSRSIGGISKRIYSLKDGGKVEITLGANNNTIYGYHPEAGRYQQISPDADEHGNVELGAITLEEYEELIGILEEIAVASLNKGGNKGSRVGVEDIWAETREIKDLLEWNESIDASLPATASERGLRLDINSYLDSNTKKTLAGEVVYDGSSYIESFATIDIDADPDDFEYPIGEGVRHSTFRKVGSDVSQLTTLFEACKIEWSDDDVQEIFEDLLNLTDTRGTGRTGSSFTISDARAAFHNNDYVTYSRRYVMRLCAQIYSDILAIIEKKVEKYLCSEDENATEAETIKKNIRKTVKGGLEVLQKSLEDQEVEILSVDVIPAVDINVGDNPFEAALGVTESKKKTQEAKSKEDKAARFRLLASQKVVPLVSEDDIPEDLEDILSDADNRADAIETLKGFKKNAQKYLGADGTANAEIDILGESSEETLAMLRQKTQNEQDLKNRTLSDNLAIVNPIITEHLEKALGNKLSGYTFPFMCQTLVVFTSCFRTMTVVNLDGDHEQRKSIVSPFTLNITGSGEGKTLITNIVTPVVRTFNTAYSNIDKNTVRAFKKTYMQGNNLVDSDKLAKKGEKDDESDHDISANVDKLIDLEAVFASTKVADFLNQQSPRSVTDSTDAGLRVLFKAQQMRKDVARATDNEFCAGTYNHPIAVFSDEIGTKLKALYSSGGGSDTYSGDTQLYCSLKEGDMSTVSRAGTGTVMADNSSITFGGNMTTKSFFDIMKKEIMGTDGMFPRINFTTVKGKEFKKIDSKMPQRWDKRVSSSEMISHYLIGASTVAHLISSNTVNHMFAMNPLKTGKLRFSEAAQVIMFDTMNRAEEEKNRLLKMFPDHDDFIKSCLSKQPKEVSIYAAALTIFDDALVFYNELISKISAGLDPTCPTLSFDEIVDLALSTEKYQVDRFSQLIKTALLCYGSDIESSVYGFHREVTEEATSKAECIYFRSIHTIEYFLYKIDQEIAGDLEVIAKTARNKSIIKSHDLSAYNTNEMFSNTAKAITRYLDVKGDIAEFTETQLCTGSTYAMRKIYNEDKTRVTAIFKTLTNAGIVAEIASSRADSRKYKLAPGVKLYEVEEKVKAASAMLIKSV